MKANIPEKEKKSRFDKLVEKHVSKLLLVGEQFKKEFLNKCKDETFVKELREIDGGVSDELMSKLLDEKLPFYQNLLYTICLKTTVQVIKPEEKTNDET